MSRTGTAALALGLLFSAGVPLCAGTLEEEAPRAIVLDVPFLPQGRLLCGGASAAMVLRYWGEGDVYAEDFRDLVTEEASGITTKDLVAAVQERGYRAFPMRADLDQLRLHLSQGRPVIALLRSSAISFHYVVVTGSLGDRLVVHDPSWGPNLLRTLDEWLDAWKASDFWALVILPPSSPPPAKAAAPPPGPESAGDCRPLLEEALERGSDRRSAEERLTRAAEICPGEAVVFRELSALRFLENRWSDAAALAEKALSLDPEDEHAGSILGASRFLNGDREGALEAWNSHGGPLLDLVELNGLARTRQEVIYRYLSLTPGEPLELEAFLRARRRAGELPTIERARLSFEPLPGGRARLAAFVSERSLVDPLGATLLRGSVEALAHRRVRFILSSPTGGGERLEGGYRWWEGRPRAWLSLSAPGMLGLPGIVRLEAYAERQSYDPSGSGLATVETWRGARLSFGDWLSSNTRAELGFGFERERSHGEWMALRAGLERRLWMDALSMRASGAHWLSLGSSGSFDEVSLSLIASHRGARAREWSARARLDVGWVSDRAPFSVWPGAGPEGDRTLLLRGHPLVDRGVIRGEGFGPRLVHGSVELERTLWRGPGIRLGLASFLDWARPFGRDDGSSLFLASPGGGVRLEVFGRTVRLDGATALGRGGFVLSAGWVEGF